MVDKRGTARPGAVAAEAAAAIRDDETDAVEALWWDARRCLLAVRDELLADAERLMDGLPKDILAALPRAETTRMHVRTLAQTFGVKGTDGIDTVTAVRLHLLAEHERHLVSVERRELAVVHELAMLRRGTR